jgi:hypothetical protein
MRIGQVETAQGIFEAHREGSSRQGYTVGVYHAYQDGNEWRTHPVVEDGKGGYALAAGGFALDQESVDVVRSMVASA